MNPELQQRQCLTSPRKNINETGFSNKSTGSKGRTPTTAFFDESDVRVCNSRLKGFAFWVGMGKEWGHGEDEWFGEEADIGFGYGMAGAPVVGGGVADDGFAADAD